MKNTLRKLEDLLKNSINLLVKLLKNMSKICLSCKKEYEVHTKDEILDCITGIIKDVREKYPSTHLEPKTCYFCHKEFEAHTNEERDNCLKKFVNTSINL